MAYLLLLHIHNGNWGSCLLISPNCLRKEISFPFFFIFTSFRYKLTKYWEKKIELKAGWTNTSLHIERWVSYFVKNLMCATLFQSFFQKDVVAWSNTTIKSNELNSCEKFRVCQRKKLIRVQSTGKQSTNIWI